LPPRGRGPAARVGQGAGGLTIRGRRATGRADAGEDERLDTLGPDGRARRPVVPGRRVVGVPARQPDARRRRARRRRRSGREGRGPAGAGAALRGHPPPGPTRWTGKGVFFYGRRATDRTARHAHPLTNFAPFPETLKVGARDAPQARSTPRA